MRQHCQIMFGIVIPFGLFYNSNFRHHVGYYHNKGGDNTQNPLTAFSYNPHGSNHLPQRKTKVI